MNYGRHHVLPKRSISICHRRHPAAIEILKSTLRTREYLEKGEAEGKTLLDAMRVGDNEGMQHFDGEIEKLIRAGTIDLETGFGYATNPGNLRLELADFTPPPDPQPPNN